MRMARINQIETFKIIIKGKALKIINDVKQLFRFTFLIIGAHSCHSGGTYFTSNQIVSS
jgi:hypothetical protein